MKTLMLISLIALLVGMFSGVERLPGEPPHQVVAVSQAALSFKNSTMLQLQSVSTNLFRTVQEQDVEVETAKVTFTKEAAGGPVKPGDRIDYTITAVVFQAASPVTITVIDALPSELTLNGGTVKADQGSATASGNQVTWEWVAPALGLPIPIPGTLTFSATVKDNVQSEGQIRNVADVEICQRNCNEGKISVYTPVGKLNQPPIIDRIMARSPHQLSQNRNVTVNIGETLVVDVRAIDPDVGGEIIDNVTLTARNLPGNATFTNEGGRTPIQGNPAEGVFRFTPNPSQADQMFEPQFTATDQAGLQDQKGIKINVVQPKLPDLKVTDFQVTLNSPENVEQVEMGAVVQNIGDRDIEAGEIFHVNFWTGFFDPQDTPTPGFLRKTFVPQNEATLPFVGHSFLMTVQVSEGLKMGESRRLSMLKAVPQGVAWKTPANTVFRAVRVRVDAFPNEDLREPDPGIITELKEDNNVAYWINQTEPGCRNDIELLSTAFQPVQVVYHEKQEVIDTSYLEKIDGSNKHWQLNLPVVKNKNTVLFGHKDIEVSGLAIPRTEIHFQIRSYFAQAKPIGIQFSLMRQLFRDEDIKLLHETTEGKMFSRRAAPGPLRVPSGSMTDSVCNGPVTVNIFLTAPFKDKTAAMNLIKFKVEEKGGFVIKAEITEPDFSPLLDGDPSNHNGTVRGVANETTNLAVGFRAMLFRGDATPSSLRTTVRDLADQSKPYLQGIFPVSDTATGEVITSAFKTPKKISLSAPNINTTVGWETHVNNVRNTAFTDALNNGEPQTSAQKMAATAALFAAAPLFQQDVLNKVQESWPAVLNAGGSPVKLDRYVILVNPRILRVMGAAGLSWYSRFKQIVYVNWNLNETTVAHEISHTINSCCPVANSTDYHNNNVSARANGYWVNSSRLTDNQQGIMGRVINQAWIEQPTYKHLLEQFSTGKIDPVVIGVRGLIMESGDLQLPPWYILDGFIDLEPDAEGENTLVILDASGSVLYESGFDAASIFHADPFGDIELSSAIFAFRIPFFPDMQRIEIRDGQGSLLGSRDITPNAPTVNITFPNGGEQLSQTSTHTLRWTASDADGDTLSYTVLYSPDGGDSWIPLESDLNSSELAFDPSFLEPGDQYLFRVLASDGLRTTEAISEMPFEIVP